MNFVNYNGTISNAENPILTGGNRSFKYGDGVFETMKWMGNRIILQDHHFERLYSSLELLKIDSTYLLKEQLINEIAELCKKNDCLSLARVRLSVFRTEAGKAGYLLETFSLVEDSNRWNEMGWTIDLYPYARKQCDAFANLKTANYLPYVMADFHRKEKGADEALLLNTLDHICEGSRTNIFLINNEEILTPALHQGCINGVMRSHLVNELKKKGLVVKQCEIKEEQLVQAEEVFLTNAIIGLRWVKQFQSKLYKNHIANQIYQSCIAPLYSGK